MFNSLSKQWRHGASKSLQHRRAIVGLSILSTSVLGLIGLYQVGILKHLPPRTGRFSAERVHGSDEAFAILATPDGILGMISYSITAAAASVGSAERFATAPSLSALMGVKLVADSAFAIRLGCKEWSLWRTLSPWSLLLTASTLTSLALAVPELLAASRRLPEHR